MNIDEFWQLIEKTGNATEFNMYTQPKMLEGELVKMSVDDILDYSDIQIQLEWHLIAHYKSLHDAAYIIGGGCSDDGFAYFCHWLIAQGKKVFDRALQDPEWLADYISFSPPEDGQDESFYQVAMNAYKKKTKRNLEGTRDTWRVSLGLTEPQNKSSCIEDAGKYEECLEKRYPKLWKRFVGKEPS